MNQTWVNRARSQNLFFSKEPRLLTKESGCISAYNEYRGDKMRKILSILLVFCLITLTACGTSKQEGSGSGNSSSSPEKVTSVITQELPSGGYISTFTLSGHEIHVYQPEDLMHADIINYGYTAPLMMVFGDGVLDAPSAAEFICEKGIEKIAQAYGASVVYVNPAAGWDEEPYGIYEAVLARTKIDQTDFSHGLLYQAASREYFIFAAPGQTVVYGYGKGADYIAKNYLKETSGPSAMSYLGVDDITITAAVLENLSEEPVIEDRNIIIVSADNSDAVNSSIAEKSDHYHTSSGSFDEIFDAYIAGFQRADGKIVESFDFRKAGLDMAALEFEVNTSEENRSVKTPTYVLGAVVFAKADSEQDKRPLVLCFHGGGDTALLTSTIAGWDRLALEEDFILCAIELHTRTTATEVMEVVDRLQEIYNIDPSRIYATGFSMGGIKTWDLYQEYPERFAAMAPMGATVDVGQNTQFASSPSLNEDVMVPVFMCGGENSQLQELPFQGLTCVDRVNYLFRVNGVSTSFEMSIANKTEWEDSVYGYQGDIVEEFTDDANPKSVTTIRYYRSADGNIYTALCSISAHQHEIRPFTCRKAWEFMKQFCRNEDGIIVIAGGKEAE